MNSQSAPQSQTSDQSSSRPWLWWFLSITLLIPFLLLVLVLLALRSPAGTAFVLDQVPGLQVKAGQGSLLSRWQASSLSWRGFGIDLQLQSPDLQWSLQCLLQTRLCVDHLRVQSITMHLEPAEDANKSARTDIKLPSIGLPLSIRAEQVRLGELSVNGNKVWDTLQLDAGSADEGVLIDRAFYQRGDIQVSASGQVQMRGNWPVNLTVNVALPPPSAKHWDIDLALSGSVRDLHFNGSSQGYLNAIIEGRAGPLQAALPAQVTLTADDFLADPSLPTTLTLKKLNLLAAGTLTDGFKTQGHATLLGTTGAIELDLTTTLTTQGAEHIALTMASNNAGHKGRVALKGQASWSPKLAADASLTMDKFPWFSLLPDLQPPPVSIASLTLDAQWQDQRYSALLAATTDSPAGEAHIQTELEGDLQQLTISSLQLQTGAGVLTGNATIDLAQPLAWDAALQLQHFNPAYWLPQLQADLNGSIQSSGRWVQNESLLDMSVSVDLLGLWHGHPSHIKAKASSKDGRWQVPQLDIAIANNTLTGHARGGRQLQAELNLELPEPQAVMAGIGGRGGAHLTLAGTIQQPQAKLSLSAANLSWQDTQLSSLQLNAKLDAAGAITSQMTALDLAVGEQRLEQLSASLDGTRQQHKLALKLNNNEVDVRLNFAGQADEKWQQWQGALSLGEIRIVEHKQQWQLRKPAVMFFKTAVDDAKAQLTFAEHCWQWQQSSLCAGDQTLLPLADIEYRIINLPAQTLAPLLPDNLRWQANINGSVDFAMTADGPSGAINLDAGSGDFEILLDGDWQALHHRIFSTRLVLEPSSAQLQLQLEGPSLGVLRADFNVDPASAEHNINGNFQLSEMDVTLLGAFTDLEDVAGQINGQGDLSGPLMHPVVKGQLELTKGRVIDPRLPIALEKIDINVDLQGYNAKLNGLISASEHSELSLQGQFDWQHQLPSGRVSLRGDDIPINVEPFAKLDINPDLTIAFDQGELQVNGRVGVPRGAIEIRGLPSQAITVSNDEVIVGIERQEPLIRSLMMDVTVDVGSTNDKVTFAAFGATGDLTGTLRIGHNMDTRGSLQLNNGRFEAYGQDLDLRKAQLLFVGNLSQPYLQLEAVREVDSVIAGLRVSGPVQTPTTEIFSTPEMPQTDALSYLVLGRAPQSQSDEGQMSRAALTLGLNQTNKLTTALGNEFGIRNLTLQAQGSGDQTAVVASGYITDDLSVRYGMGIFEPMTTMALRYDLGRYFYLEAASGFASSLDIFYTQDF